jgi:pSer/pThr/pTyr-binding forkhead associated (FHA) protein
MALTVVVRSGDVKSLPEITFDAPRIVIGRGDGCEVRLPDPSISHRHASIRQRGTEYIIIDEGSTNGTFVGPVRLSPQAPRVLRSGDLIRVGRIWLEVRIEQAVASHSPQLATKEIALSLVAGALSAQGEPSAARVVVAEGPDAGRELSISEFERAHVIGRGSGADLALEDADCSRRHVEVFRRGDNLYVRELGSKNGAELGERKLEAGKDSVWPRAESLRIGANRLVYEDPLAEALSELERAADERMQDDDSIDPPRGVEDGESSAPPAEAEPGSPFLPPVTRKESPVVARPTRRGSARRSGAFSGTDLLIALIALGVLAASILGLVWLFRSN